jgi:GntR family transcriptional regulator / MocR family aminotransferase
MSRADGRWQDGPPGRSNSTLFKGTKLVPIETLDRARGGLGAQLTAALRDAVADGRLAPGARLPSTRDLAADLRVSRGVVVEAYEQLVAEGRLVARHGAGTVVAPPTMPPVRVPERAPVAYRPVDGPLRPGVPDLSMFPRAAWRRAYETALAGVPHAGLDYGPPAGPARLREELAGYLNRVRAARAEPAGVIATAGVAQALSLLAAALRHAGVREIAVEDPCSIGVRGHLAGHDMRLTGVPVDAHGLVPAALAATGAGAVVLTPAHQYPTGVVLAPGRRAELIAWARRTGGLIIEDDYDAEFRYDRDPVGCLQGLAPDVVAHTGSVSKALAPGLRLGWLVVPAEWAGPVLAAKEAADLGGPVLEQSALAELIASGGYDRHLRAARREHRRRRDALLDALATHLPQVRVTGIAAGLHLVVELPPGADDRRIAEDAARAGIAPIALSTLRLSAPGPPGLVLGYARDSPSVLRAAVFTLEGVLRLD